MLEHGLRRPEIFHHALLIKIDMYLTINRWINTRKRNYQPIDDTIELGNFGRIQQMAITDHVETNRVATHGLDKAGKARMRRCLAVTSVADAQWHHADTSGTRHYICSSIRH